MKLSKHHYALELAGMGHLVYFFEPANLKSEGVKKIELTRNLWMVNYPLRARGRGKLPQLIYSTLLHLEVKWLLKQLRLQPDIVWCFDSERLNRLRYFNTAVKIFHPVDFFGDKILLDTPDFDISLSPMQKQVDALKQKGYPSYFVNHGLSAEFIPYANARQRDEIADGNVLQRIRAGYVGNLLSEPPDREAMKKVIEQNPNVDFHFWGSYESKTSNLANFDRPYVFSFVEYLKSCPNVSLHGPLDTAGLAKAIQDMDMFWICWDITRPDSMWNKDTNPHKIIEYLSTGKPIVSHYIEQYAGSNLVDMMKGTENEMYPELFNLVIQKIRMGTEKGMRQQRIEFALQNAYNKHLEEIFALLEYSHASS